jgi:uncharacterized membrane protein YbhN (UPF0104 family)
MRAKPHSAIWNWTRAHWKIIKRVLLWAFILALVWFLVMLARDVDWDEVMAALRATKGSVLLTASGWALLSYALYSLYDILGKAYTGSALSNWKVIMVCAISYAFNLSLGSFVGGVGFRYRLYAKLGLRPGEITRILGLSLATNWIGYCWIAGAVFASGMLKMPAGWEVGTGAMQVIGVVMVAVGAGYIALCGVSRRRAWTLLGHEIEFPSLRLAVLQCLLAVLSWASIGGILWMLLERQVGYMMVLGVFLLSAIAGALAHIPGGIGVIEAVFVGMLAPRIPASTLIGALVVYRAIYYLAPLLAATVAYLALEAGVRKQARLAGDSASEPVSSAS